MAMIVDPNEFFANGCGRCQKFGTNDCVSRKWQAGLSELRRICLAAGLDETAKWGHPCYMYAGRNIVLIGALQRDIRLNFFNAALMKDPEGILVRQGPNTPHPDSIKFESTAEVLALEPVLQGYLDESKAYAAAGIKPKKSAQNIDLPQEMTDVFDDDAELADAFFALTPGRQKSYVIHINSAKLPATKRARIIISRSKILAGKGATER